MTRSRKWSQDGMGIYFEVFKCFCFLFVFCDGKKEKAKEKKKWKEKKRKIGRAT